MGNTYRIIDGVAVVGRRGGPVGSDGRSWDHHVDGSLANVDFGRLHADPVGTVILREGGAAEGTIAGTGRSIVTRSKRIKIVLFDCKQRERERSFNPDILIFPIITSFLRKKKTEGVKLENYY